MAFAAIVFVLLVIAVSTRILLGKRRHAADQLPGPPALPFIGNALSLWGARDEALKNIHQFATTYWPLLRIWIGTIPVIMPLDPKDVEVIMTSSLHISKSHDYSFIREWLGDGLLTSTGSKWHRTRKMLTPTFHFNILEQFVPVFSENTRILLRKLRSYECNPDGVDIVPLITKCALDIICETAMGTKMNAQEKDSQYVSNIYELNELLVLRMLRPWLQPNWIYHSLPVGFKTRKLIKNLHEFTDKVIRERREELNRTLTEKKNTEAGDDEEAEFGRKRKTAFLDLLLSINKDNPNFTDKNIREEVDTFMFEGHDTTAMAMSWACYFLGKYPDIQNKCVDELKEIFSGSDRDPTLADLGSMKYLERVIKETLRLKPSVHMIARKLEHTLQLDGKEFPAGITIYISVYSIHRNPKIFPDPEKFDPDRFSPENSQGRHPYVYIPFSAGPRNCIGQKFAMLEMKDLLSTVLRHFRLETINPEHYYSHMPDLMLRPKFGVMMRIYPRGVLP